MKLSFVSFFSSLLRIVLAESEVLPVQLPPDAICVKISQEISSASNVYYPGNASYATGIYHWATSSDQVSKCVVEPGSAQDVAISHSAWYSGKYSYPFRGHTTNLGFSSTTGVQISMSRFSDVVYNASSQTAEVGAGLIWDDVYAALEPYNVNVVGGRVTGIGVAGFTLGGGYSWKTNQHGLTIDTVTAFELVKPNGDVATITEASDPDLFFGLKGGFNNFGIVTKFTLQTFPQTQVWGGLITFGASSIPQIAAATATFSTNVQDPKAAIITIYNYILGETIINQLLFYDAPSPPAGIFDDFLAVPYLAQDVKTRSFVSLVQIAGSNTTIPERGVFNTVSLLSYTPKILDAVLNETTFWGPALSLKTVNIVANSVEPFLSSLYTHNAVGSTAFPPIRSLGLLPFNIHYAWNSSAFDDDFHEAARLSAAHIYSVAVSEGQTPLIGAPVYPNYAIYDTPLKDMYGDNLPRLKGLKAVLNPSNVMGLAGGFKF